jgi:hypothetical protein
MNTIFKALLITTLTGCANMTSAQFGDIMLQALAQRVATSPGYNWQQGIRDGQDAYTQNLINHRLMQVITNDRY